MPPIRFADNLRAARARLKLNQTALGRQIGIGQGAITKWETGKSSPTVDQLLILADALGATAADLLAGCVHAPTPKRRTGPRAAQTASPPPASQAGTLVARRPRPKAPAG